MNDSVIEIAGERLDIEVIDSSDLRGAKYPLPHDVTMALLDQIERVLSKGERSKHVIKHHFSPGVYIRECHMEADSIVTSWIHRKENRFFIMMGQTKEWTGEHGWRLFEAPYFGTTLPGTRRMLHNLSNVIWFTVHPNPTDSQDIDWIENELFLKRDSVGLYDKS